MIRQTFTASLIPDNPTPRTPELLAIPCNLLLIYYVTLVTTECFLSRFRKILKIFALTLLLLVASMVSFHFWLIAHAKNILAEIVRVQSKGKYHLDMKKVTYDYLKLRLEIQKPALTDVDTSNPTDKFELHAQVIILQLEELWPLIYGRRLLIDSILLDRPIVNLSHQKRNSKQQIRTAFSLSVEMEKLYQSIQSVLTTLKVGNFRINKGVFTLNSNSERNIQPLKIKDIDFYIKGFNIDSASISLHPNSYTEDIQLRIGGQTIRFPDGDKAIRFSSFLFIANKGNLEVDSCSISGGDNDSTKSSFNLYATKMRIKNVFLAVNDSTDYNRIDSLFFTRPKVSFSIQIKDARDSSETIAAAIRKITSAAFGRLLVRYVSINNVDFDIEVERKEKVSTFSFVQDSLVVSNLGVGLFPSMPISASSIRFGVKEFVDYFRDSTYLVHFDSVRINNDQFSLFNINIESTARVKKGNQKIYIPVLQMQGIDWYQLISHKKLVASNFTLHNPFVSIIAARDPHHKKQKKNTGLNRLLRQMFVIKNIAVLNGSMHYNFSANDYLSVKNINTFIRPDLSTTGLVTSLPAMIRNFDTGEFEYVKDGWKMTAQQIVYGRNNSLSAANINLTNNQRNLHLNANNVNIEGMSRDAKSNLLTIKEIAWKDATVVMDLSKKVSADNNSLLSVGRINGSTTALKIVGSKTTFDAKISILKSGRILLVNGKPKELHDIHAEGTFIDVTTDEAKFHSGKFMLKDKSSSKISSLTASFPMNKNLLNISVPEINFEPDIQQSLSGPLNIRWLKIVNPAININKNASIVLPGINRQKSFPKIDLTNIEITDPLISFKSNTKDEPLALNPGNTDISATSVKTSDDGQQLDLIGLRVLSKDFSFNNKDSLRISSSKGLLKLAAKSLRLYAGQSSGNGDWRLDDGSIDLPNLTMLNKRASGQEDTLQVTSFYAGNFSVNKANINDPVNYFITKPVVTFSNLTLNYKNKKSRFIIKGLKGSATNVSLDSFLYRPQLNRNAFMAGQAFQKDYITAETGAVVLNNIDIAAWLRDSVLRIEHVQVHDALLNDTRDKHLPLQQDIIKGLPVTIIKNIPVKTRIDSVTITNGRVRYHEISEKTNQTGNIRFTRLNATVSNIKNYNFFAGDSLQLLATGYLMDAAFIRLHLKESYGDSLASFPVTIKVKPFDMKILNPFLLPVMSVRIKSGIADSIFIRAIGREYLSLGEMRFYYHDLKVEFLKAADDQRKTFLTSLLTFAANSFVIRTKNTNRVGKIYYERSRNRSFFNYLVKMIASGAASSVGAKRSQKYNSLYNERIKELNLPEIVY